MRGWVGVFADTTGIHSNPTARGWVGNGGAVTSRRITPYNPDKHHRRSIRLRGYDYSQSGAYYITTCTHNRRCLFGKIADGEMRLNDVGQLVQRVWDGLPEHYPHVELDAFVMMPNHVHGIVVLTGTGLKPTPTAATRPMRQGLPEIIRAFKTFSARRINDFRHTPGTPVWQRNYYEHIIRNEDALNRIRQYIADNPDNWAEDRENPHRQPPRTGRPRW